MPKPLVLGLDLGSTAVKSALVDTDGLLVATDYRRHNGRPLVVAPAMLQDLLAGPHGPRIVALSVTGSASRPMGQTLAAPFFNEVVALAAAMRRLHPRFRTAIEVGGDCAKIIELADQADAATFRDFAMNTECAAGTGSFLDQQASRLGVRIENEFGAMALRSRKPPRVAGRCSVFAKSDMIHLQQQAVPDYDIVAGLCFGMARNFKATLARGRDLKTPIALVGGVASNAGMVRAFREVLELADGDFAVPEHHDRLPAIGAALLALRDRPDLVGAGPLAVDPAALDALTAHREAPASRMPPLCEPDGYRPSVVAQAPADGPVDAYLGIDVGSISTNLVLIDAEGRLFDKLYLMTAGRPIEAVRGGLKQFAERWGGRVRVLGAATTGSGRYLTGDIVGADVVRNEITAQARGAIHVDPCVDTIFEIGGQDSKYIRLRDGVVVDFEMNHVCAAGTGSFLEEQAERLGIDIKGQFAELALSSRSPIRLGERCTVFMESDIMHHQQQGAALPDLVAGLSYSIAANYLNRVVGTRSIGDHILFQGGTAFNRAVTAAFAALTGRPITVPPHHEVTGALGVALLARDAHRQGRFTATQFRGFDLAERPYTVRSFTCQACSNYCDIREVRIEGQSPLYYGSRCDRYNKKTHDGPHPSDRWPDLMAYRQRLLLGLPADAAPAVCNGALRSDRRGAARGTVGIPRTLVFHQMLPFWRTLLEQLGFEVLVSPASDAAIIQAGVESVLSQTCFPVKVAHGHVRWLADQGVDAVLLPSILALPRDHDSQRYNHLCPYVQTFTYQIESALDLTAAGVKVLRPIVDMEEGYAAARDALVQWGRSLDIPAAEMSEALDAAIAAQDRFEADCRDCGRRFLEAPPDGAQPAVLIGRPYNTCDAGINLDVAQRMRDVGLLAVPMDMLDLRRFELGHDWDNLYWKYGQRIIRAAEVIRQSADLVAVYISNFGCGPDSFIKRFFQEAMGRRAFLSLEIDEHSAAAGLVTRLEAFVDSLRGTGPQTAEPPRRIFPVHDAPNGRTLLVPHMCDHAFAFAAAFRGSGLKAQVIPPSDDESLALGRRYTSGRECLPCIVTAGDMLRELQRPDADPSRMAFFMPSGTGPCRFGMYSKLHRLILQEAGFPDVPIVSPNQGESFYEDFKKLQRDPTRPAWCGIVAVDALTKALHATRPYERIPGATETAYAASLKLVEQALERGDDLMPVMTHAADLFRNVPLADARGSRPLVALVGEIYVRSHAFSNQDVVRRLEALGLEVDLASFAEGIYYTNWTRKRRTRGRRQYRLWLGTWIKEKVQRFDERRIKRPLADLIGQTAETETPHVVALGHPYVHDSFEGEAVLSLGKAVEAATHPRPHTGQRAAGIVNVMPFTCMPGNIVAAMLKRLRRDLGDLPILSVAYDGQRDSALDVRLEAFAEQVKAFAAAKTS